MGLEAGDRNYLDRKLGVRTGIVKMIHLQLSNFWLETLCDCLVLFSETIKAEVRTG